MIRMLKLLLIIIPMLFITGCAREEKTVNRHNPIMRSFEIVCNQYGVAYYIGSVQGGFSYAPVLKPERCSFKTGALQFQNQ
jgi:PBP1b-binding outer membrane lipoprotein LpoB